MLKCTLYRFINVQINVQIHELIHKQVNLLIHKDVHVQIHLQIFLYQLCTHFTVYTAQIHFGDWYNSESISIFKKWCRELLFDTFFIN